MWFFWVLLLLYSDPIKLNFCSVCYKKHLGKKFYYNLEQISKETKKDEIKKIVKNEEENKIKITRCNKCNKKLGIYGIKCKCGLVFCNIHRDPCDHDCNYDFKAENKNQLKVANPKVEQQKVDSI